MSPYREDTGLWPRERFRKSTKSDGSGNGNCVAIALQGNDVAVGDTKAPIGDTLKHLQVTTADLQSLIADIKTGKIV
jgi:hypothetical protein